MKLAEILRPDVIEILIITYHKEFDMLNNLLSSMDVYLQDRDVRVRIILQGEGEQELLKLLNKFNLNFKLENQNKYLKIEDCSNGWQIQQFLKLSAARYSDKKYTLVLDCKHIFLKNFSVKEFFSEGKVLMPIGPQTMHAENSRGDAFRYISEIYGLNWKVCMEYTLPTVTPYVFINKFVFNMVDYIEKKFKMPFSKFFFMQGFNITEFYLYALFLHKDSLIDKHYKSCDRKDLILWGVEDFRSKFDTIDRSLLRSVAFHRRVLEANDPDVKMRLNIFLKKNDPNEVG